MKRTPDKWHDRPVVPTPKLPKPAEPTIWSDAIIDRLKGPMLFAEVIYNRALARTVARVRRYADTRKTICERPELPCTAMAKTTINAGRFVELVDLIGSTEHHDFYLINYADEQEMIFGISPPTQARERKTWTAVEQHETG